MSAPDRGSAWQVRLDDRRSEAKGLPRRRRPLCASPSFTGICPRPSVQADFAQRERSALQSFGQA